MNIQFGIEIFGEPSKMVFFGNAGSDHQEIFFLQSGQSKITDEFAGFVEHRCKTHPTLFRDFAGQHLIQPEFSVLSLNHVFGKSGGFH